MSIQEYPFYFKKFEDRYLVVNVVGEHVFLDGKDFEMLLAKDYSHLSSRAKLELESRGFISDTEDKDFIEDLLATKLRSRKAFLNDFTSLHMVVLTLRCNCHCDYCHASAKSLISHESDMSIETAKEVLNVILQSPSRFLKIEFQGGEPSLNWPALKYFVEQGKKIIKEQTDKYLEFVICTNLYDLSDEQIDFLIENQVAISTSCDGPKYLHDLHRKSQKGDSTYDRFLKNLRKIQEKKGKNDTGALLTVTKDNLFHLPEVIDQYIELGFQTIFIRALNPYGYALDNQSFLGYSTDEFVCKYEEALHYILELNKKGIFFIEAYASLLFQRIMTPFSTGFVDLQSPAGAGISGAIYFYNGDVYPADEARMLATRGNSFFKMGNVHKNNFAEIFSSGVMKNIVKNSIVETMPGCATCAYNPYCGADPVRYYTESNSLIGKRYSSQFCKKNKAMIEVIFRLIKENDPQTMAILWSWVFRHPMEEWQCGK